MTDKLRREAIKRLRKEGLEVLKVEQTKKHVHYCVKDSDGVEFLISGSGTPRENQMGAMSVVKNYRRMKRTGRKT